MVGKVVDDLQKRNCSFWVTQSVKPNSKNKLFILSKWNCGKKNENNFTPLNFLANGNPKC
jgi:hypothetical protein